MSELLECNHCGKCCVKYPTLQATSEDLDRWENRPDILKYVGVIKFGNHGVGDLWISPVTGDDMDRCPFLRKGRGREIFKCRIHECRPNVCRGYPYDTEQMVNDECEMLPQFRKER